ncbi:hypothetical protein [Acidithiobacillus sp. HP-2]|uniref:hypothetical protein n=1 Tax=Acidithiobacillus sp. HP-2 TaxID=2697654 RepID=UPI0018792210|nr:hypothetical protein [Acidithiobacillus sp. HP-2]MBE7568277.1 hypothetical protein [Acidithiobacillus sp. HP-2]
MAHRPALQGGRSLAAHPLIYGLPRMSRDAPDPPAKNGHWRRVWVRLGLGGGVPSGASSFSAAHTRLQQYLAFHKAVGQVMERN